MPKYYYKIDLNVMEKAYFENTQVNFFKDDNDRIKFNGELLVIADNEQESQRIREGMTDIRMWILDRVED
jgi:hypothetical protein